MSTCAQRTSRWISIVTANVKHEIEVKFTEKQSIQLNSKLGLKPRAKIFCTTFQIISKWLNRNSWKFQNHSKVFKFFKCKGFGMKKTFTTYQISMDSSTFPSPLARSRPRSSTVPWSVSKRDCVLSESKHLRACVQPFTLFLFPSCMELGGFNDEGTRWQQPRSRSDCMKDNTLNTCPMTLDLDVARM